MRWTSNAWWSTTAGATGAVVGSSRAPGRAPAPRPPPRRYGERVAAEISGPDGRPIETRQAPPPMVPAEVAKAVRALAAGAEVELGMPVGRGKPGPRIKAIIESGQPLPPELYAAV